ncbi:MAG: tyrosine-type recombinase/integrase [Bacteroidaceae bacterium]|nr:tyrosine-type recombinase/integrase [Bacteroidaceae bacterium]
MTAEKIEKQPLYQTVEKGGGVKLLRRLDSKGSRYHLCLEFWFPLPGSRYTRRKKNLHLFLFTRPRTPMQREHNRDTLTLARKIRWEEEMKFSRSQHGYALQRREHIDLYSWLEKEEGAVFHAVSKKFRSFSSEHYPYLADKCEVEALTSDILEDFSLFLSKNGRGGTAKEYWRRLHASLNRALKKGLIEKNPCSGIKAPAVREEAGKDILSPEEISLLAETPFPVEKWGDVKRAFLFSCFTGIRWCDIKKLVFNNIDFPNKRLTFVQAKVAGRSKNSTVIIPLNEVLLDLIGEIPPEKNLLIFHVPATSTHQRNMLRGWVAAAGIKKHITWHCARHSFGVNALSAGADIKTVADILGHSTITMTERYTRAVDALKEKAIDAVTGAAAGEKLKK